MGTDLGSYMKLQFGFEDIPYSGRYSPQSPLTVTVKKRRPKTLSPVQLSYGQGKTTGQVATDIEKKYGVTEVFYKLEEDNIGTSFEDSFKTALENAMSYLPFNAGLETKETDLIEKRFRRSLSTRRFDGLIPGVPTRSSLRGISHLRRKPMSGTPRSSFINTGLYQHSFKAWMEP